MLKDLSLHIRHNLLDAWSHQMMGRPHGKVDKMDVYVWKKDFEKTITKKQSWKRKKKEYSQLSWDNVHHH